MKKNYCDSNGMCTVGSIETDCRFYYNSNPGLFGQNFCTEMVHITGTRCFECTNAKAREEAGAE